MKKLHYHLMFILLLLLLKCNTSDLYDVGNFSWSSVIYFSQTNVVSDSIYISNINSNIYFVKSFYPNGEIAKEYFTRNGELHGVCRAYGEGGKIFAIIEYDRGKIISENIIKE